MSKAQQRVTAQLRRERRVSRLSSHSSFHRQLWKGCISLGVSSAQLVFVAWACLFHSPSPWVRTEAGCPLRGSAEVPGALKGHPLYATKAPPARDARSPVPGASSLSPGGSPSLEEDYRFGFLLTHQLPFWFSKSILSAPGASREPQALAVGSHEGSVLEKHTVALLFCP